MTDAPTTRADHAELARLAEAAMPGPFATMGEILSGRDAFIAAFTPAVCSALLSEIAALRGERDRGAGESVWWRAVIGDGSHQPSGEVRSIKHMHPAMVKPIYDAHKGTAVADVIAGLIFSLAITQNREQFLVEHANDRATQAERQRDELRKALELAAIRFDEIYEDAEVDDNAYRNEATIHGINGNADVAQSEVRQALANQGADQ